MGVVLTVYRLDVSAAVDVLSNRRHAREIADEMADWCDEARAPLLPFWRQQVSSLKILYFHKMYSVVHECLSGTVDDQESRSLFYNEHLELPISSVIYGARRIGWDRPDFPLKYSLPDDISDICDALTALTEADIQHNVETLIASGEGVYSDTAFQRQLREQFVPRLLPALRQFYHAAREREEIVVYWMG